MIIRHNISKKWKESFQYHRRWYAWYPVSNGNAVAWLVWVERIREASWHEVFWTYKINR